MSIKTDTIDANKQKYLNITLQENIALRNHHLTKKKNCIVCRYLKQILPKKKIQAQVKCTEYEYPNYSTNTSIFQT